MQETTMAMTDIPRLQEWSLALAPLAGWPDRQALAGARAPTGLWTKFRTWLAQRQTVRILNSVDTATLKDLGISPRDLESVVYGDPQDRMRGYDKDWWRRSR
jgi:uncharacterized protein YjiS (DUF1127 family)